MAVLRARLARRIGDVHVADLGIQSVRAIPAPRIFHPGADDKAGYWEDFGLTVAFDFSEASASLVAVLAKNNSPTRLFAFDLASGVIRWQRVISNDGNAHIRAMGLGPDGGRGLVPTGAGRGITLWDVDTGVLLDRKTTDGDASDVDWHPGGELLAVVAGRGIEIWRMVGESLEHQRFITASRVHGEWPLAARWSPDGAYLAIGTNDPGVVIGKADGSVQSPSLMPHPSGSVSLVEWSPSGDRLAAGTPGAASPILIWRDPRMDVDSPFEQRYALLSTINPTASPSLGTFAWDPSGQMVAVGDGASNLRIHDATSGDLLTSIPAHPNSAVM